MKAVRVHRFGGPEVLKYETDVPLPFPGPCEVLISVKAIGVNPVETYIRTGAYARLPTLPAILGHDCCGVVAESGEEVAELFKPGDRVYVSRCTTGAYAEYTVAPAVSVHPLPSELSFVQGAALPVPYLTAYRALFQRGSTRPGNTVLVHGASGGVGVAAVQLARHLGAARVLGTAGTKEGVELVRRAGAHAVFNHREDGYLEKIRQEAGEGGVDLVVENAAHVNLGRDLTLLARGGRVMIVGSRGPVEINPRDTMSREADVSGVMLFNATKEELAEAHAAIRAGVETGWLRPIVGKEYQLEDASQAHSDIIGGSGALGKTVLVVN